MNSQEEIELSLMGKKVKYDKENNLWHSVNKLSS